MEGARRCFGLGTTVRLTESAGGPGDRAAPRRPWEGPHVPEGRGGPPAAIVAAAEEGVRERVRIAEVEPSGLIVLGCGGCGAKIVLFGREEDWRGEGRVTFGCAGCGGEVGLAEREEGGVGALAQRLKPGDN